MRGVSPCLLRASTTAPPHPLDPLDPWLLNTSAAEAGDVVATASTSAAWVLWGGALWTCTVSGHQRFEYFGCQKDNCCKVSVAAAAVASSMAQAHTHTHQAARPVGRTLTPHMQSHKCSRLQAEPHM